MSKTPETLRDKVRDFSTGLDDTIHISFSVSMLCPLSGLKVRIHVGLTPSCAHLQPLHPTHPPCPPRVSVPELMQPKGHNLERVKHLAAQWTASLEAQYTLLGYPPSPMPILVPARLPSVEGEMVCSRGASGSRCGEGAWW